MSLDLGAVIGRVILETVEFDRTYVRIVRQFSQLGTEAGKGAAGTIKLDDALAGLASSGNEAAAAVAKTTKASGEESAAASKAALAEQRRAVAVERVAAVMAPLADATAREQQAALRDVAAQERLTAAREGASSAAGAQATATARVAAAQASAIGASERAAASQSRLAGVFASSLKMAGQLGLIVGAVVAVKKAVDIVHEAASFQKSMLLIQTQAGGTAAEVNSLTTSVLGMAGSVATAPDQLATSLYHVYSVGLRGAKALDVVRIAAEGAKVGNADLEQTTNALTATVASGIGGVHSMAQAMGVLNSIVGAGDMRLSDLNDALGTGLLARMRVFGVSIQESGAALAVFGDNNIRGADAATALRMAVQDIAKPGANADSVLAKIGLTADDLRKKLEEHGLTGALHLLNDRMTAAGVTGDRVGAFLEDAFTKKAGAGLAILLTQLGRFDTKLAVVSKGGDTFASRWDATTKTASFAWSRFSAELDATGIKVANDVLPQLTAAGKWLGDELPAAASALGGVLSGPLSAAWTVVVTGVKLLGDVLGPVISLLGDIKGPLADIATLALGAWVAFKVGAAIPGILDSIALRAMYMGDSFIAAKARVVGALTGVSVAAATTATDVDAAGAAATIGWRGLLGPLAAVAVGVGLLISMFHSSSSASKEATAAAKAYTDALDSIGAGQGDRSTVLDAITKQLNDNNVPQNIEAINKGLARTAVTGGQFVSAIEQGGKPLADLQARLEGIVAAGTRWEAVSTGKAVSYVKAMTPAAKAAAAALDSLNSQYSGMTAAQAKEIAQLKAYGTVATPVQKVADKLKLAGNEVATYAGMLGLAVTKSGDLADSTQTNVELIGQLADAADTGTQTVSAFVQAWNTFAASTGTAADRAALIGATLKAANGDALNYASAINAAAVADAGLVSSLAQAAKGVGKHGESVHALVSSIMNLKTGTIDYTNAAAAPLISGLNSIQQAAMAAAQATFQHARQTMNGKDAADAAYQTYVSQTQGTLIDEAKQLGLTKDQARALAKQYFGMPAKVKTLIEQEGADPVVKVLNEIGLQLSYLTGHKWTSTLDANPGPAKSKAAALQGQINAIRQGKVPGITANTYAGQIAIRGLQAQIDALHGKSVTVTTTMRQNLITTYQSQVPSSSRPPQGTRPPLLLPGSAGGNPGLPDGWSSVGEGGAGARPELIFKRGSAVQVYSNSASKAIIAASGMRVPGFAAGTGYTFRGHTYSTLAAMQNAENSYAQQSGDHTITRSGGVVGVANLLNAQIPASRLAMARLSAAVNDAFTLHGIETKITAAKQRLTDMVNFRTSLVQNLSGGFDASKYGSVSDLLFGLGNATTTNNQFAGEIAKLRKEGLNSSFLARLIQQGPSATLDSLSGASASSISAVNKAVGSYYSSLSLAGDAGTLQKYGATPTTEQAYITQLDRERSSMVSTIDKLVAAIASSTGRPVEVKIGNEVVAKAVFDTHEFKGVLDELSSLLHYGHH